MRTDSQPLVSVIMPIYNAKEYVEKAVYSVCCQTYRNLEIILILDGATDGSDKICERLAENDERIIVIHQKNGGICNARNHALCIAKGKYVAFCDHDDKMMPRCIEVAVDAAERDQSRIVKFVFRTEWEAQGRLIHYSSQRLPDAVLTMEEIRNDYQLFNAVIKAMWNGLYLTSTIQDNGIRFNENVRYGLEDYQFNLELIRHVPAVKLLSEKGYVHYSRVEQSTSEKFSASKMEDCLKTEEMEKRYMREHPDFHEENWVWHQACYLGAYTHMLFHPDNPMRFRDKRKNLKEINRYEKLGLQCNKKYVNKLFFQSPKRLLRAWLFDMKLYGMLIIIDTLHEKLRNKGLLRTSGGGRADS